MKPLSMVAVLCTAIVCIADERADKVESLMPKDQAALVDKAKAAQKATRGKSGTLAEIKENQEKYRAEISAIAEQLDKQIHANGLKGWVGRAGGEKAGELTLTFSGNFAGRIQVLVKYQSMSAEMATAARNLKIEDIVEIELNPKAKTEAAKIVRDNVSIRVEGKDLIALKVVSPAPPRGPKKNKKGSFE